MDKFALAFAAAFLLAVPLAAHAGDAAQFPSEEQAQKYCPTDTVVWYNRATGYYHFKGKTWYGVGVQGTYICLKEAQAAGYKTPKNM